MKNYKKNYVNPCIEVVSFSKDEIIATSGTPAPLGSKNSLNNEYLSEDGYKL